MKTWSQQKQEQPNKFARLSNRINQAPATAKVLLPSGVVVNVPISKEFAPILEFAENNELLDIALKYDLPVSKQQVFLLSEGDTYLDEYEKIGISEEQELELLQSGWSPLMSSNILAVKQEDKDLLIRFHSGEVYRYPDKVDMYIPFNEALSPGRLLHRTIRFARGYEKL